MNEAAFPHFTQDAWKNPVVRGGLTKRELFAAMALQGLLACPEELDTEYAAHNAVACADALIAELEKTSHV